MHVVIFFVLKRLKISVIGTVSLTVRHMDILEKIKIPQENLYCNIKRSWDLIPGSLKNNFNPFRGTFMTLNLLCIWCRWML